MTTAEEVLPERSRAALAPSQDNRPIFVESDLKFIAALRRQAGDSYKKCIQCGTCSSTCEISPDWKPFPRKEMAWAVWGMKERLLNDPDIWLCYQCNDCSTRCPRGARPGDVLGAVRQECIRHYSFPRFLGKWAGEPQSILLMLGIPAALLTLALAMRGRIESAVGISTDISNKIVYSYSSLYPHWMLNSLFLLLTALVVIVAMVGVVRFWRALKSAHGDVVPGAPTRGILPSIISTLKNIITHRDFKKCTSAHSRLWSHGGVLFGFTALSVVTIWVFTSGINPLLDKDFVYPFGFWSPWKLLANVGGVALLAGCLMMIYERLRENAQTGHGSYSDWALLGLLLAVVGTGFVTEVLHYLRLEPHRHLAYYVHLIFAGTLILYLPYSKLAHLIYRTTAMVFAEHTGRTAVMHSPLNEGEHVAKEAATHA